MISDSSSFSSTNGIELLTTFQLALQEFDGIKVNAIIQQGLDIHKSYSSALHELVVNYVSHLPQNRPAKLLAKFNDVLNVLVENGLDVNVKDRRNQNQTALHLASFSRNQSDIIGALLRSGARVAEPDTVGQTALHKAAMAGSKENIVTLLGAGADPNVFDNTGHSPLHLSVRRKNNADILKTLISSGAKVNLNHPDWNRQSRGATPLHIAARLGRTDNAMTLLEMKAEPNIVDATGQTALHVAAAHELTGKLCDFLLKCGAKMEMCDTLYGETALHKAAKANMVDNVRILMKNSVDGNDVNRADHIGDTALHKAALTCREMAVWLHLFSKNNKQGLNLMNKDGNTPMTIAQRAKNSTAVAMIKANLSEF